MQQQATRLLGYGRDLYAWEQKADDKWDDAIELAIHVNGATVGNGQPELLHSFKSRSDLRQLLHDLVALYHSQLQLVLQQLRQVRMAIFLKVLH